MIISASRRTDIPTYYYEWLFNRFREEYVLVRNPMNVHQIGKINLSPDVVDGIVFWTKNPIPMMERLKEIERYNYYFQFTVNPYGKDVEPNVPSKSDVIIPAFQRLSKQIGKDRVIWRYDPILLNSTYTIEYHISSFRSIAEKLSDYTEKCTVSFIDLYKNTMRNIQPLRIQVETREQQIEILDKFSNIAKSHGIYVDTCAEALDQIQMKVLRAHCIDKERFERLGRYKLSIGKDKNQRVECGCIESIDIGAYNTCKNGCLYCYANYSSSSVKNNFEQHDPTSPLLFGTIGPDDVIKERAVRSCKECQMSMFE